jgi:hypothetical protein
MIQALVGLSVLRGSRILRSQTTVPVHLDDWEVRPVHHSLLG